MEYLLPIVAVLAALLLLGPVIRMRMDKNIRNITSREAYDLLQGSGGPTVLDVRTKGEFQFGHIPGARNIPVQELASRIGELNKVKDKPILVHCASGSRSPRAALLLSRSGFSPVYHLPKGLNGWPGALKH